MNPPFQVPMQQYGNTVPVEGPAPMNPSSSSDPNSGVRPLMSSSSSFRSRKCFK